MSSMIAFVVCLLLALNTVYSFRFSSVPMRKLSTVSRKLSMEGELVPIDKTNTINAAAVTGGVLGLVLGGPVLAVVLAAVSNYAAKSDNEAGEALRGFGKTVLESLNFLSKLNSKYDLTGKASETVTKVVSDTENDTIGKISSTYKSAVTKLEEVNKEYDLVTKGKEVLVAASTLSDAVIEKAVELNQKYDLVGSATKVASTAVEKAAEAAKSATKDT